MYNDGQENQENNSESVYYRWSKEFLEAGKQRLVGNTKRQASSDDVAARWIGSQPNGQLHITFFDASRL
jgi:hypothetical protein